MTRSSTCPQAVALRARMILLAFDGLRNEGIADRLGAAFAEPAPSPENIASGRDAKGRFARGNAGGPGNPFARRTAELRRAFLAEASGEDLRAVCRALLERAKGGDVAAAKLALGYLVHLG